MTSLNTLWKYGLAIVSGLSIVFAVQAQSTTQGTGQQYGMQTLDQCLQDLLKKGMITKEDARQKAAVEVYQMVRHLLHKQDWTVARPQNHLVDHRACIGQHRRRCNHQ